MYADPCRFGSTAQQELLYHEIKSSVAEPEPVEPKLFWDLEPEPKINFNKNIFCSQFGGC